MLFKINQMAITVRLTMKDYYYILGVDANCTTDEVKDAYRKLSKKFHPDVNQNDSYFEDRFKEIHEAYGILSDPETRKWYDDKVNRTKAYPPDPGPVKQRRYPRTTAVDIIFTIILIGITVLFGKYVVASMSGTSKIVPLIKTAAADTPKVAAVPVKHHKKKKHHIIAVANPIHRLIPVRITPVNPVNHPAIAAGKIVKPAPKILAKANTDTFKSKPVIVAGKPVTPVRVVSNVVDNNIPYSSYLRSNITGVVNMRRSDDLNSDILAVIPTHSKVLVLQKGNNYYKVEFNGDEGYVPKWTVLTK